jgi:hypothetical protein
MSSPTPSQALTKRLLLHVGCGPKRIASTTRGFNRPGWQELRLDIDASVGPDVIGTMTDMGAVQNASVDAIFSSHNMNTSIRTKCPWRWRNSIACWRRKALP